MGAVIVLVTAVIVLVTAAITDITINVMAEAAVIGASYAIRANMQTPPPRCTRSLEGSRLEIAENVLQLVLVRHFFSVCVCEYVCVHLQTGADTVPVSC